MPSEATMAGSAWKRLADHLETAGMHNPYHARVKAKLPAVDGVAVELMQEMASALRRSEEKVTAAIAELDVIDGEIAELRRRGAAAQVRARMELWNKQRDAAAQALWELRVHREAIGFRLNGDLAERYPIPPKRRLDQP
jgi:DNA primase catalytic subunit